MKKTITFSQFCDAFRDMDRNDAFSYDGKRVLFDELSDYEQQTGSEVELDVIALCCEFNESTLDEIIDDYRIDDNEIDGFSDMDDAEKLEAVTEWMIDRTWFMGQTKEGSIVYQAF